MASSPVSHKTSRCAAKVGFTAGFLGKTPRYTYQAGLRKHATRLGLESHQYTAGSALLQARRDFAACVATAADGEVSRHAFGPTLQGRLAEPPQVFLRTWFSG